MAEQLEMFTAAPPYTPPPFGLIPPEGYTLVMSRGLDRLRIVESARHPGYFFICVWWDAGPSRGRDARKGDRAVIAEGFPRPVRRDGVSAAVDWLRWMVADAWELQPTGPSASEANPYMPPPERGW